MRGGGDPAGGDLVGDGEGLGEGDGEGRVGDVEEGGARVGEVGARDDEVCVVLVEEIKAEEQGEGGEGGEGGVGADLGVGLVVVVVFNGEGVDEARVFAVAADGDEEGGRGGVEGDVLADCQGAWDWRGGILVLGLGDGAEAAEGCEAFFAVDGVTGYAGDGAGVEDTG